MHLPGKLVFVRKKAWLQLPKLKISSGLSGETLVGPWLAAISRFPMPTKQAGPDFPAAQAEPHGLNQGKNLFFEVQHLPGNLIPKKEWI